MKLIHCADLHLDSKMNTHLTPQQVKERKAELLHTFAQMVSYAQKECVAGILIAGDLFDTRRVSATAAGTVLEAITTHPDITFYYLKGNHDTNSFLSELEEIPENLELFDGTWKYFYPISNQQRSLCIAGIEIDEKNNETLYHELDLKIENINIVMLHGQEGAGNAKDKAEIIRLKDLKNKGIDYLALGHVHTYKKDTLDSRGVYCYSGCLEGRGFDECGPHGFVLLDISMEEGTVDAKFVPFAFRKQYEIPVDVSECTGTMEVEQKIRDVLEKENIEERHMVRILLKGERDCESNWNMSFLQKQFGENYYCFQVKDATRFKVDYEAYALDASLKGEFIRRVMDAEELTEEEKAQVVRFGICALKGEEF